MKNLKCVVVGDGSVGKTWLINSYIYKKSPVKYMPTVFDNYSSIIKYEGENYNMSIWDTAGQEEYDTLRSLSYPYADVFILCYAVNNSISFRNVKTKWLNELRKCEVPIVLVATKIDARIDAMQESDQVTFENGRDLRVEKSLNSFIECSAIERINIDEVFLEAVKASQPVVNKVRKGKGWTRFMCCGC